MPAHKRSWSDSLNGEEPRDQQFSHQDAKQSRTEREPKTEIEAEEEEQQKQQKEGDPDDEGREEDEGDEQKQHKQLEEATGARDSEGSLSSSSEDKPEFVFVELSGIRRDVQCPICLGIIKKTRTVMECLHRFCRECIDKSMRLGNNECPACRTHCASRRSLRDDPNYDALIAALYPDIDKYEEEELTFHEEERNRNKQIQESIAQIFQRQSEALSKKRILGKDMAGGILTRSRRNHRNAHLRRQNGRGDEVSGYEDNEDEDDNNEGKDSSSADERFTEVRQRRKKRHPTVRSSQPSSSIANIDSGCTDGCAESDLDMSRENRTVSPGLVLNSEMLGWGRGGVRSNTRHGSGGGSSNKSSRSSRLTKLVNYLRGLEENSNELDVHLLLISVDKESTPSLQQPHLHCRPSLTVEQLREYVSRKTPLQADEVEILSVKDCHSTSDDQSTTNTSISIEGPVIMSPVFDPLKYELQILEGKETLAELQADCNYSSDHLILGYRRKGQS
ncbi:putative E3 ubiquitin-protein ligase RING1a [Momordica charantia]|uniref:E3 ubiquitin-protein ligase RING1a n=1 Tax=Momordica charantia TaxID=3673 RepID=A0A6J1D7I6_MOMCH|nr:putative E3 ubiquitin-protein ligase RING1a [Momordica charantia]XP_022149716.1 putative E3 ubiquitin-protein ligase RING1a [Momordica charantia]XP_022149717.1 putative E3 ubiquitin-protein ligase RING1a [Momordica charantia]XP_022149718.1 putative E3 ubiquitin-protein ligase RING1a [Momordica charantia]XP_022149720.1 putative E3 ubiquitin-protein ligase RING1a [Momordica charantia]